MSRSFSTFIAQRYLFARRSLQFISVITALSLTGIMVGVAAIICVSSIFNGFRDVFQTSMLEYDPHIRISPARGMWLSSAQVDSSRIVNSAEVRGVQPVIAGRAVISAHGTFHVVQLHGVQAKTFGHVSGLARSLVVGEFRDALPGELPGLVVGAEFANAARIDIDDTVNVMSPNFIESALQSLMSPQGLRCVVRGVFYTNSKEYNGGYAYCDRALAAQLYSANDDRFSELDIRLVDAEMSDQFAASLRRSLGSDIHVETWYDLHKDLYGVMKFERLASFVILSLIVLVSVFNIFAMLSMTIVKKRTDIAIMMTMGANPRIIQRIFLAEGLLVGVLGTSGGLVLGLGLCAAQIQFKLLRFDPQSFIISAIPVRIAWPDVIAISLLSIAFSFVATIVPARRAAATQICDALRSE